MISGRVLILLAWAMSSVVGCASSAERQSDLDRKLRLSETYTQLGASYLQRGQLEVAKENLTQALEINPDNQLANNMMALLRWRLKEYDQAEKYFRRALEGEKVNSDAWNNYGIYLCERGKFDEAERAFGRALADPLYQTPAEANINAGICQMRKPSPSVAEKYFRAALDINPKQPQALLEMAKLTYNVGRTVSARAFVQRYFETGEDTPEALLIATKIESTLGNRDAEASYAVRLRGKFPNSAEAAQLKANERAASPRAGGKKP